MQRIWYFEYIFIHYKLAQSLTIRTLWESSATLYMYFYMRIVAAIP